MIQAAVQHGLRVAGFYPSAQIFNAGVIKDIRTNLAAPADIGFVIFHRLFLGIFLLHLQFIKLRFHLLHGLVFVLVLGTVVLALGHDPGRDVGNTHRRFGTVNVLTARAGRAINVNAQIRRVDFDINIIINFRINKRGAERRVATTAGVKRAFTHQAVNAGFCTQPAVSVIAGDFDSHGFNTRHFTFRLFDDFSFETTRFCPAQIHTLKHARPVLCFRTARPRLNIEVAVGAVIFAREHTAELKLR